MKIVPLNETTTVQFIVPSLQEKKIVKKIKTDPAGLMANGLYKVVRWEGLRQLVMILSSLLVLAAAIIWMTVYHFLLHAKFTTFIIPSILIVASGYKLIISCLERQALKQAVSKYQEDLRIGISSIPPFIIRLYQKLHEKQVAHNWFTITTVFYGGLLTILLWWLKGVSWWIFDFKEWIRHLFANPELMTYLFTAGLVLIVIIHIIFTVQRKKVVLDLDSFFGRAIISLNEIEVIKSNRNKKFRNLFILSVIILLLVPLVVKLILHAIGVLRKK